MSSPSKKLLSTGKARPRSVYDGTMALPGWSSELLEIEQQTTRLLEKTRSRPATKNTLRSIDQQGTREIQRDRKKKKKKKKTKKKKKGKKKKNANDMSSGSISLADLFSTLCAFTQTKKSLLDHC
mmetsp:Transcript_8286/g.13178  ORF Transcript_8286/g.13178 Transcript_8286/m.13178 type:complete len:125 (-) Transcript_8286:466-840(-)